VLSDLGARIVSAYRERQFEVAVGAQSTDMRLALSLDRELTDLSARSLSNDGLWFTVMATPPLRTVFQTALGLPPTLGTLDIDRQLGVFKDRARSMLGTDDVRQLAEPGRQNELLRRFLLSSETAAGASLATPGSTALAILQGRL
jgi:hypothetical protein